MTRVTEKYSDGSSDQQPLEDWLRGKTKRISQLEVINKKVMYNNEQE